VAPRATYTWTCPGVFLGHSFPVGARAAPVPCTIGAALVNDSPNHVIDVLSMSWFIKQAINLPFANIRQQAHVTLLRPNLPTGGRDVPAVSLDGSTTLPALVECRVNPDMGSDFTAGVIRHVAMRTINYQNTNTLKHDHAEARVIGQKKSLEIGGAGSSRSAPIVLREDEGIAVYSYSLSSYSLGTRPFAVEITVRDVATDAIYTFLAQTIPHRKTFSWLEDAALLTVYNRTGSGVVLEVLSINAVMDSAYQADGLTNRRVAAYRLEGWSDPHGLVTDETSAIMAHDPLAVLPAGIGAKHGPMPHMTARNGPWNNLAPLAWNWVEFSTTDYKAMGSFRCQKETLPAPTVMSHPMRAAHMMGGRIDGLGPRGAISIGPGQALGIGPPPSTGNLGGTSASHPSVQYEGTWEVTFTTRRRSPGVPAGRAA
jgi:hypothetical protein